MKDNKNEIVNWVFWEVSFKNQIYQLHMEWEMRENVKVGKDLIVRY